MLDLSHVELVFNTRFTKMRQQKGQLRDYSSGIATFDGFVYLVGLKGVHLLSMASWQERIKSLMKQNLYVEAIALGLSFYDNTALAQHRLPHDPAARQTAVRDFLINIIDTYADLSIASNSDVDATVDNPALHARFLAIVQLVVESCLAINANDFLFSTIFDKLSLHPIACGVFFESLRPLILDDKVDSLPPAVMKMFVEHFKEQNRPDIVEECVIRMDVTTMDIHQMVSLCWEHKLFDAMIYIYNQGMNDYLTPLREMMQLLQASIRARSADVIAGGALHQHLDEQELELGYKLLLYISFCLAGRAFPRGDIPKDRVRRVKWEVYRFVLMQHGEQQETTTYPHLRALLQFDTKEFLNVLAIAFDETDLVANPDPSGPALPSRQVVVESLLFVMVKDNKGKNMTFTPEQVCHLFTFIARQVSRHDNIISVDRTLFDQVLRRLTSTDAGRKDEQEQALLDLLDAGGLAQFDVEKLLTSCEQAGFYMVCERVYSEQQRYADIVPCYLRDPARQHLVFPFIHRCLKQQYVPPSEAQKIKEATVDHIEDFVRISAQDTAKLILACFNPQLMLFAQRLSSTPELFYQFLKSVFHLRDRAPEGTDYNLPAELEEAFIEAMCRDHPTEVYNYLKTHEHVRIEQCLVLTKRYKLTDATAWLLERKGEFLQAYALIRETLLTQLSQYNLAFEQVEKMLTRQEQAGEPLQDPDPDPREPAIKAFRKFLDVVLDMLQRCSRRMPDQKERRSIWCKTLEVLIEFQQIMRTKLRLTGGDYAHVMNRHMKEVVRQMAEFVDPPAILHLIMSGGAMSDRFDDIRDLVTGMLETYNYERTQLQTTNAIIHNDVYGLLQNRQRALRHAYPSAWRCNLSNRRLYGADAVDDDIIMFRSGQCTYLSSLPRVPRRFRKNKQDTTDIQGHHNVKALDRWIDSTQSDVSYLHLLTEQERSQHASAWDDEPADPHAARQQAALDRLRVWENHVGRAYDAQVKPKPRAMETPAVLKPRRRLKLNVTS
ncbi:hypothetical protein PTSG_02136 [Salpingoeca rosetta]|uniref:Vacuolar protein sorting-associated protein 8 central domain-containing protein n=1 Tax=Salpingoeca rosetta (strain ATCC 50818 / BSB-021) TaxID=946362 RepID=F2U1B2_SALR5|nr:uncharacterized protein PTSG_02136 [Salpingoeca rosetta]EGD81414.1 hypothetical protein PTSG_02136 [Salpingoeca rosetta]|eukprot:XP_004996618.1 hypothetical protein PTSG_02136 [Salpingoeca rosetta]